MSVKSGVSKSQLGRLIKSEQNFSHKSLLGVIRAYIEYSNELAIENAILKKNRKQYYIKSESYNFFLGNEVKKIIQNSRLTQVQNTKKASMLPKTLNNWIGDYGNLSNKSIYKIICVINEDVNYLLVENKTAKDLIDNN